MQRGKLDSTLARCPRHPYPCGVAARFWSSARLLARAKHPALSTQGQERHSRTWKNENRCKKVDRIGF